MDIRDLLNDLNLPTTKLRPAKLNELAVIFQAETEARVFKVGDVVTLRAQTVEAYETPEHGEHIIVTHVLPSTKYLLTRGQVAARVDFIGAFVDDQHKMIIEFPFDGRDFKVVSSIRGEDQPAAE